MLEWKQEHDREDRYRSATCPDASVELAGWYPAAEYIDRWPLGGPQRLLAAFGPALTLALA